MVVARLALAAQLVGMIVFSTIQYSTYSLTNDFGGYAQAWYLIGHGHLNPYVTVFRSDFLHNNLDLAMYPLALIGRVFPHPVMLSWAQDAAIVATEWVVLAWARDVLDRRAVELGRLVDPLVLATGALLALDPWSWETAAFSLHFGAFAAFFAVLGARALYRGHYGVLVAWAPLAMAAESLGSLYLLAAALGCLAARTTPRPGRWVSVAVAAAGLTGVLLLGSFGLIGRSGATLASTYSYLWPRPPVHAGPLAVGLRLLSHPGSAAAVLRGHLIYVVGYVIAGGTLGLASSWGLAAVLVIILPNALSGQLAFIAFPGAFQSWPAQPFLVVGSVMVAVSLALRIRSRRPTALMPAMRAVGALTLSATAVLAGIELSALPNKWLMDPSHSRELALLALRIPAGAEVIANQDIIGRLSIGRPAYSYVSWGDRVPISAHLIAIILPHPYDAADEDRVRSLKSSLPNVRTFWEGANWIAIAWSPSPGTSSVTLV